MQQVNLKDLSYRLQEQVMCFIDCSVPILHHIIFVKVNMLTAEVFLSLPRITAMEYGDLDLSLIPTVISQQVLKSVTINCQNYNQQLIGTTLTYLIILCQFQSSEE